MAHPKSIVKEVLGYLEEGHTIRDAARRLGLGKSIVPDGSSSRSNLHVSSASGL